ncbi:MAG: hypothetical protein BMS9Abin36_0794 [Gammaproteobacteria bacterium]|nr:MAG: hypothetical protein BMS9Abin36_0794 [Gammaproteobacteria bacterium]
MTAESVDTKTFRLSRRLSVELSVSSIGIVAEWLPDPPDKLTYGELSKYRKARGVMLERLADKLGGAVVLIES